MHPLLEIILSALVTIVLLALALALESWEWQHGTKSWLTVPSWSGGIRGWLTRATTGNGLILINVLSVVLIGVITLFPSTTLQIVLGLPFVIFLPGYVLIAALFPKKDSLDGIERVGLSFVTSIAVTSLLGLLLNFTPWGIRVYPMLVSLAIFILATSIIMWYRWQKLAKVDRFTISFNLSLRTWSEQNIPRKSLSVILMVAILGTIGIVGYIATSPRISERFTEFYLIGFEDEAKDSPTELKLGEEERVTVGIINREHETVSYRVEVRINGVRNSEWGPLVLGHDEKREEIISFHPSRVGDNQKVEFLLCKQEQTEAYRSLYLWVNVIE
ncbi:DUF1616 domain-containing protein [Chloroflexota bacterium]